MKTIKTIWEVRTYDVWGNEKDGYDVNDSFVVDAELELEIPVTVYNVGTPSEFESATPTDRQLRQALDVKPRVKLSVDGDDINIYVHHESTNYPFGELYCVSHESLSPIRAKEAKCSVCGEHGSKFGSMGVRHQFGPVDHDFSPVV